MEFDAWLAARTQPGQIWIKRVVAEKVGPAENPDNYMGPVINAAARRSILNYIEMRKQEGRLVAEALVV